MDIPDSDPDVEIVTRELGYQGYTRVERFRLRVRRFDGSWSGEMRREVVNRGNAVAVLPYDPRRDEVILIEQFRLPQHVVGYPGWPLEIVGGIVEAGETFEEVARREAAEEAGVTIRRLEKLYHCFTSPGILSEQVTIYCGEVDTTGASGVYGLPDEHEEIKVHVHSAEAAIARLDAGQLDNAIVIIALSWLARNRDALRRRWTTPAALALGT